MAEYNNQEIELAFVREFAVGDNFALTASPSRDAKRERIRVAIISAEKINAPLAGSNMTYAQAYDRLFGQAVELRRVSRDKRGAPLPQVAMHLPRNDTEERDDADEPDDRESDLFN
jgi:hypothetical protein